MWCRLCRCFDLSKAIFPAVKFIGGSRQDCSPCCREILIWPESSPSIATDGNLPGTGMKFCAAFTKCDLIGSIGSSICRVWRGADCLRGWRTANSRLGSTIPGRDQPDSMMSSFRGLHSTRTRSIGICNCCRSSECRFTGVLPGCRRGLKRRRRFNKNGNLAAPAGSS